MIKIVESYLSEEIIKKRLIWENDERIRYFTTPNFKEELLPERTYEEVYIDSLLRIEEQAMKDYLIFDDDVLIGECNLMVDPRHLFNQVPKTAWIGLVIGEEDYRGKGIGRVVMEFLEDECRKLKLKRIELGVFEFNQRAVNLYLKMDYKIIAYLDDFTYHRDKWERDIRLEKIL